MDTQKMVRLSLLVSLATVLSILENQLPIPRPLWLKLGLANVITLLALIMYGMQAAVIVACVRALLAGIFGVLPMIIFSLPAAFTSSLSMGVLHRVSGRRLSIIGLSVSGAVVHNLTQLLVAYFVLDLSRSSILGLAPILVLVAVGAGLVTGLIARYLIRHLLSLAH
jgi:heptaprenyl diphosphate synthase